MGSAGNWTLFSLRWGPQMLTCCDTAYHSKIIIKVRHECQICSRDNDGVYITVNRLSG